MQRLLFTLRFKAKYVQLFIDIFRTTRNENCNQVVHLGMYVESSTEVSADIGFTWAAFNSFLPNVLFVCTFVLQTVRATDV